MTEIISLPFDHVKAHEHITRTDKRMARVIAKTGAFRFQLDQCDSVYESLLEAIAYQSISRQSRRHDFRAHQGARLERPLPHACRKFLRFRIRSCAKRAFPARKPRR